MVVQQIYNFLKQNQIALIDLFKSDPTEVQGV